MDQRFEAMLDTALTLGEGDGAARVAAWRQVVDIVAQAGAALSEDAQSVAFERLELWRATVPEAERRFAAASLAGRTRSLPTALVLGRDQPSIAAPFLMRLKLTDDDWERLLAELPATSRNILRNRRDLSDRAIAMLARFAPGDLALPPAPADAAGEGVSQIRDLVDRIAAFKQRSPSFPASRPAPAPVPVAEVFAFEADLDGMFDWIDGVPREALLGLTLAECANPGGPGVDGQAAGAWRRRAPFSDARLLVAGDGPVAGNWLISAAPLFNPRTGRFCGYQGNARRPLPGERAEALVAGGGSADTLRQLVHELRTPLNAIQGFAEMIDGQLLGPAAYRYRKGARAIQDEAQRLAAMVDDVDTTARIDQRAFAEEPLVELALLRLTAGIVHRQAAALARRDVAIRMVAGDEIAVATRFAGAVERIVARLLAAIAAAAGRGETVTVEWTGVPGGARLSIARPRALVGLAEAALLDPQGRASEDLPDGPLLGLGFTLRLVDRLAHEIGGRFAMQSDRFELIVRGQVEGGAVGVPDRLA